jgi:hypothetical protein
MAQGRDIEAVLRSAVGLAWAEEERFRASLTAFERTAAGTHDRWSAKDLIAHVAAAKRRLARAIAGGLATLEHDEADVYRHHAGDSWPQVEADAAEAARDLHASIGVDVRAHWLDGRPIESLIAGYGIRHPLGHIADYLEREGKHGEAERVRAAADQILQTLPSDIGYPDE